MSPDSEPRPPTLDEGAALRAIVEGTATASAEAFFAALATTTSHCFSPILPTTRNRGSSSVRAGTSRRL
jgi:hypothetical protein